MSYTVFYYFFNRTQVLRMRGFLRKCVYNVRIIHTFDLSYFTSFLSVSEVATVQIITPKAILLRTSARL